MLTDSSRWSTGFPRRLSLEGEMTVVIGDDVEGDGLRSALAE